MLCLFVRPDESFFTLMVSGMFIHNSSVENGFMVSMKGYEAILYRKAKMEQGLTYIHIWTGIY